MQTKDKQELRTKDRQRTNSSCWNGIHAELRSQTRQDKISLQAAVGELEGNVIYICVCVCVCMYVFIYMSVYIYIYAFVHIYICVCTYIHKELNQKSLPCLLQFIYYSFMCDIIICYDRG